MKDRKTAADPELARRLTPEQYHVTQEGGTERPFSGRYYANKARGTLSLRGLRRTVVRLDREVRLRHGLAELLRAAAGDAVETQQDSSLGQVREEVRCANCGAHLGHVFPDGPQPTGLRYCINSAALDFESRRGRTKTGTGLPREGGSIRARRCAAQ